MRTSSPKESSVLSTGTNSIMIDIKDGLKQKSLQLLLNQLKKRHNQDG